MKTLFTNAIDALLEDDACMVPCRLIFEGTKFTDCPNCILSVSTKVSSNKYQTGGPMPFNTGICPYCQNRGLIRDEQTETVYLLPIWDYKDWVGWKGSSEKSRYANGSVQTMSAMSTISNLKRAKEIIINTDIEKYTHHRFTIDGEPTPIGFGADSYIFTMWKHQQ